MTPVSPGGHTRHRLQRRSLQQLGEPEVGEDRGVVFLEEHVRRLDVPVNDPEPMRVVEAGRDAAEIFQRRGRVEGTVAQLVGEASAGDELDDHVGNAVVLAEVVDVDDVRVAHLGDRLRLVAETRGRVRVGSDPLQYLDRARALQLHVVRAIDEAHRSLADEVLDLVLP